MRFRVAKWIFRYPSRKSFEKSIARIARIARIAKLARIARIARITRITRIETINMELKIQISQLGF